MSDVTEELVRSLMETHGQSPAAAATAAAAAAAATVILASRSDEVGNRSTRTSTSGATAPFPVPSSRPSQACATQQRLVEASGAAAVRPPSSASRPPGLPQSGPKDHSFDHGASAAHATVPPVASTTTLGVGATHLTAAPAKPRAAPPASGGHPQHVKVQASKDEAALSDQRQAPAQAAPSSIQAAPAAVVDAAPRRSGLQRFSSSGATRNPESVGTDRPSPQPPGRVPTSSPGGPLRPGPRRTSISNAAPTAGEAPSTSGSTPPSPPPLPGRPAAAGSASASGGATQTATQAQRTPHTSSSGGAATPTPPDPGQTAPLRPTGRPSVSQPAAPPPTSPRGLTQEASQKQLVQPAVGRSAQPAGPAPHLHPHPHPQQQHPAAHAPAQQHPPPAAPAGSRAVRFSTRDSPSGSPSASLSGSEAPAASLHPQAPGAGAPLPPPRRISDSSSTHLGPKAPGHGPAPPPPGGATRSPRPSDDGLQQAAGRRPVHAASSEGGGAAPAHRPPGADALQPPGTGAGTGTGVGPDGVSGGGGGAHGSQAAVALGGGEAAGASSANGLRRPAPTAAGGAFGAAGRSSGAGQGGPAIRRAGELAPLSLPGGLDTALREALALAAAQNVSVLAAGELLPEQDFGYARIVAQHHAQEQKRMQHQQQPQAGMPPSTPPQTEQPGRRTLLWAAHDAGAAAAAAAGAAGGRGRGYSSSDNLEAMAGATAGAETPSSSSPQRLRPARQSAGTRSMRSVLKNSTGPLGAAGGSDASAAGATASGEAAAGQEPLRHLQRVDIKGASGRSLFRNVSGRSAAAGTDDCSTEPDSPVTAAAGRNTFAGGVDALDGLEGSDADGLARDLALEENVDVRIHGVTFNMSGVVPQVAALPESLFSGSYLSPDSIADAAHVYVFATQESGPLTDWEAAVAAHLGRRYKHVATESLMSIHICLFAVKSLAPYIKDVRTSSVATGVGNVLGNKGGVAVTFGLLGAQVLVVGAHFAAHDQYVERRNADFHRICAGLFAPPTSANSANATSSGQTQSGQQQQGGGGRSSITASPARQGTSVGAENNGTLLASGGGSGHPSSTASGATPPLRRYSVSQGPTLSRFSRGGAGAAAVAAAAAAAAADSEPSVHGPTRALTRTLSSSSVSSCVSTASAYPGGSSRAPSEAPSRMRAPSFLSGFSFATAQQQSNALLAHFDVVLWMGDLNYRIAGTPEVVKYAMDMGLDEVLRANDQLLNQRKKGKVLQGFQEMPISFAPTFKFTPGTDTYDLKRTPAWTDRVLYLVNADPLFADLRPLYYMSVPELRTSDHKPVIAGFELSISPQHAGASHQARQKGCSIM